LVTVNHFSEFESKYEENFDQQEWHQMNGEQRELNILQHLGEEDFTEPLDDDPIDNEIR
jgi:hypothetical protein